MATPAAGRWGCARCLSSEQVNKKHFCSTHRKNRHDANTSTAHPPSSRAAPLATKSGGTVADPIDGRSAPCCTCASSRGSSEVLLSASSQDRLQSKKKMQRCAWLARGRVRLLTRAARSACSRARFQCAVPKGARPCSAGSSCYRAGGTKSKIFFNGPACAVRPASVAIRRRCRGGARSCARAWRGAPSRPRSRCRTRCA